MIWKKVSFVILLIVWTAIVAYFAHNGSQHSIASVIIENKASREIEKAVVDYKTGSMHYLVELSFDEAQEQTVLLPVHGEGGYELHVKFKDGTLLKSGSYLENKYRIHEIIQDQAIIKSDD